MADKAIEKEVKKQSLEEMEAEIKAKELELRNLEILEKKANLQDLAERLAERQMKRENKGQRSKNNGSTLQQSAARDIAIQSHCNHRKGGDGLDGFANGQGTDSQYAIIKHTFGHGDTWIRCLRCGKTWKPPVKSQFYFNDRGINVAVQDGVFNKEKYEEAIREYKEALNFQTRNVPSGSYQFRFTSTNPNIDPLEVVREQLASTNLR